ncbi:hypothetical protein L7F22_000310 [Adiantum nelumboides]|nr:hypothetical protein [Adiantum nelumboides]
MKLPLKLSKGKSSSPLGSPLASPLSPHSPAMADVNTPPLSPMSPSKLATSKSFLAEKGKSLRLRLSRSRSHGSKRENSAPTSPEPSPKPAPLSPLGQSSSSANMHPQAVNGNSSNVEQEPFVEEMKRTFKKFDSNGDGKISAGELQCILKALGDDVTRKEAELMVAEVDTDKDGFIDLQEFINLNVRGSGANGQVNLSSENNIVGDELAAAFNMFDLDKDGCITPKELHCVLGNLGNHSSSLEDCKRMINNVAGKGCGYVDFDDFKRMMATSNTTIMA